MLELKYLYKLMWQEDKLLLKLLNILGILVYFECEYYRSLLFEMQYGDHRLIER